MSEWQPIETAPEKADVLVYCTHGMYVAHCYSNVWYVDDNKNGPYLLRGLSPTHWMPIPQPPKGIE